MSSVFFLLSTSDDRQVLVYRKMTLHQFGSYWLRIVLKVGESEYKIITNLKGNSCTLYLDRIQTPVTRHPMPTYFTDTFPGQHIRPTSFLIMVIKAYHTLIQIFRPFLVNIPVQRWTRKRNSIKCDLLVGVGKKRWSPQYFIQRPQTFLV